MKRSHKWVFLISIILILAGGVYAFTNDTRAVERVTIRGIAFSDTGAEMNVERKEEVELLVSAFENAKRTEGAVKAIGNNMTFSFHLDNGYSIEYPVWEESSAASFEDPTKETETEEGIVRFNIASDDWEKILKIIDENS